MGIFNSIFKKEIQEEERFILSIDGGGMRGIIPAVILSHLSKIVDDNIPFYAHFDLIAGTSTGGIIALGLTNPNTTIENEAIEPYEYYITQKKNFFKTEKIFKGLIMPATNPERIESIYVDHGKEIFSQRTRLLGNVFSDKYDSNNLEFFFRTLFHDEKLKDALVPTMVVSYDSISGRECLLSSYSELSDTYLRDAARATSAAPLYFSPKTLFNKNNERMSLLDGGVIANNPAVFAYLEAKKLYPNAKRFHILSISTARNIYKFDPTGMFGGLSSWAEPIMKIYPNAQMVLIDDILNGLPDCSYVRIFDEISDEKIKLDDTRLETIERLKEGGQKLIEKHQNELNDFAAMLSKRTLFDQVKLSQRLALTSPEDLT